MVETFNLVVAIGTLLIGAFTLLTFAALAGRYPLAQTIARHSTLLLRIIFIGAALGSLTYELYFGYAPCLLCWYQRMAIFPVAILSLTGSLSQSALLRKQVLALSGIGFAVAVFHNYIDLVPNGLDVCGTGASCLLRYVDVFGFVTIPLMSGIVLLSGIALALVAKRYPQLSRI